MAVRYDGANRECVAADLISRARTALELGTVFEVRDPGMQMNLAIGEWVWVMAWYSNAAMQEKPELELDLDRPKDPECQCQILFRGRA